MVGHDVLLPLLAILALLLLATDVAWVWMIHKRWVTLQRLKRLRAAQTDVRLLVSVIIPGRNVGKSVKRCLSTLIAQKNVRKEVIFVDDDSMDDTCKIVLENFVSHGVKYVRLGERPDGWLGKNWACWRGYNHASGDWLLFIDADTVFSDDWTLVEALNFAQENRLDALSLIPLLEASRPSSKLMLPLLQNILWSIFSPVRVNDLKKPMAFLFGAFILIRREVYERIGGHEAVRGRILEDRAIARVLKAKGYRVLLLDGSDRFGAEFAGSLGGYVDAVKRLVADYAKTGSIGALKYFIAGAAVQLIMPQAAALFAVFYQNLVMLSLAASSLFLNILSNVLEMRRLDIRPIFVYALPTLAANWILTASLISAQFSIWRGRFVFAWRERRIEA